MSQQTVAKRRSHRRDGLFVSVKGYGHTPAEPIVLGHDPIRREPICETCLQVEQHRIEVRLRGKWAEKIAAMTPKTVVFFAGRLESILWKTGEGQTRNKMFVNVTALYEPPNRPY